MRVVGLLGLVWRVAVFGSGCDGFEEYGEMGTRWMAQQKDGQAPCSFRSPKVLPASLKERLAFFAFISMDEHPILEHWLTWYKLLGVPFGDAARTKITVHAPPGELGSENFGATLRVLKRFEVAGVNTTSTYSSKIKQSFVNEFMRSLPVDALLMYPDSDEFFAFPCDVAAVVARDGAVHGHMVERMASTWEFLDVAPVAEARVWDQFPLQCGVTGKHLGANHFKQMLTPMVDGDGLRVFYRSSHNVYCVNEKSKDRRAKHCGFMGDVSYPFSHYRFTKRAHALVEHKRDVYKAVLRGQKTPETDVALAQDAAFLASERSLLSRTARNSKDGTSRRGSSKAGFRGRWGGCLTLETEDER